MTKHLMIGLMVGCISVLACTSSLAAVIFGSNPFNNIAGTGATASNAEGGNAAGFYDGFLGTCPYRAVASGVMYYTEQWATPHNIAFLDLWTGDRAAAGTIYKSTTLGGTLDTGFLGFDIAVGRANAGVDTTSIATGAYGIKIEVNNDHGTGYYQFGDFEALTINPGPNLALGAATTFSAGSTRTGSISDGMQTSWRAPASGTSAFVQWEYAGGAYQYVRAFQVSSGNADGTSWGWYNWDLYVEQAGTWNYVGQATNTAKLGFYWVDLGERMAIQGMRLVGTDENGNNPVRAGGGLIVEDVRAFDLLIIPEPATMLVLGGAMVGLARRKFKV